MAVEFLVTHSGGFHADELLSSVILTRLYPTAKIVRSRAPEWITPAQDRVIYDVGAYDAEAQIFDHHHARRRCVTMVSPTVHLALCGNITVEIISPRLALLAPISKTSTRLSTRALCYRSTLPTMGR